MVDICRCTVFGIPRTLDTTRCFPSGRQVLADSTFHRETRRHKTPLARKIVVRSCGVVVNVDEDVP